jgi:hypothetical protein
MKNQRRSLLQFFALTVIGVMNLYSLLDRPFFANIRGGDFVRMIGTGVMFGLAISFLAEYFFGRRSS